MGDRGYSKINGINKAISEGADVIVRFNPHSMTYSSVKGEKINLVEELKEQEYETTVTISICIGKKGNQRVGYLHCYHLNEEQSNKARRKLRQQYKNRGKTPSKESLFLAGWVLVFTTVAPSFISAQQICDLYRIRWQIELAIKRLKSLLDLDLLRAKKDSPMSHIWINGKLLYALAIEKRARRVFGDQWARLDQDRHATWWRFWKMIKDQVHPMITAVAFWKQENIDQAILVLTERSRKRKLQRISQHVLDGLTLISEIFQRVYFEMDLAA